MSRSPLRDRGLQAVVDTTDSAEWDVASFQISDGMLERISRRLAAVTHSPEDRTVGAVRVRELEGYDVVFGLSREPGLIVITVCGIRPPDPENPTERVLQKLGGIAMLRGATGL